jgi:predicted protein tyrosine phosphatase
MMDIIYPALAVLGYSEAGMFLRARPEPEVSAVISIHGKREFGVELECEQRLDLAFDDVEVVRPGDLEALERQMMRRRWNEQNGLVEVAPTKEDAAAIVEFAARVRDANGIVLCQCDGGISRAPAAAVICLAVWRGAGCEEECVAEVRRLRRGAVPHAGLVGFADEVLGRGGRLVGAVWKATHR